MSSLEADVPLHGYEAPPGDGFPTVLRPPLPRVKRYSPPDPHLDAEGRIQAMVANHTGEGGILLGADLGAEEQARRVVLHLRERSFII